MPSTVPILGRTKVMTAETEFFPFFGNIGGPKKPAEWDCKDKLFTVHHSSLI